MSAGLRLIAAPADSRAARRPTANAASRSSAYAGALSSFQGNGHTSMPRSTATVRVVVKERTSTTTATAAPVGDRLRAGRAPVEPDGVRRLPVLLVHRTRTTDLPRVRRSSMSASARPKSSSSYVAPIGGLMTPASIIGTSSAHCCCM